MQNVQRQWHNWQTGLGQILRGWWWRAAVGICGGGRLPLSCGDYLDLMISTILWWLSLLGAFYQIVVVTTRRWWQRGWVERLAPPGWVKTRQSRVEPTGPPSNYWASYVGFINNSLALTEGKTSQELRMLSRSLSDCQSLGKGQTVSNSH